MGPGDLTGVLVKDIDFLADERVDDVGAKVFFLSTEGDAVFLWLVVVVVVDLTVNLLDGVEVTPTAGFGARNVEGFAGQAAGLAALFNPESMRDDDGAVLVADGLCWKEICLVF